MAGSIDDYAGEDAGLVAVFTDSQTRPARDLVLVLKDLPEELVERLLQGFGVETDANPGVSVQELSDGARVSVNFDGQEAFTGAVKYIAVPQSE